MNIISIKRAEKYIKQASKAHHGVCLETSCGLVTFSLMTKYLFVFHIEVELQVKHFKKGFYR